MSINGICLDGSQCRGTGEMFRWMVKCFTVWVWNVRISWDKCRRYLIFGGRSLWILLVWDVDEMFMKELLRMFKMLSCVIWLRKLWSNCKMEWEGSRVRFPSHFGVSFTVGSRFYLGWRSNCAARASGTNRIQHWEQSRLGPVRPGLLLPPGLCCCSEYWDQLGDHPPTLAHMCKSECPGERYITPF